MKQHGHVRQRPLYFLRNAHARRPKPLRRIANMIRRFRARRDGDWALWE